MRDPNRLHVMDAAMKVAELTYRVTRSLPPGERAGLSSQMRRSAASIGANISEGCGRSSEAQFITFLNIAMGSACELEFHVKLAARLGLAPLDQLAPLAELIISTKRMLARLINALRARARTSSPQPRSGAPAAQRPESSEGQ